MRGGEECGCCSYLNKYYIFTFQNSEVQKGFQSKDFPTVSLPPSSPPNLKPMLPVSPSVLSEARHARAVDFYRSNVGGPIIYTQFWVIGAFSFGEHPNRRRAFSTPFLGTRRIPEAYGTPEFPQPGFCCSAFRFFPAHCCYKEGCRESPLLCKSLAMPRVKFLEVDALGRRLQPLSFG